MTNSSITIRPFRVGDEESLRQICRDTTRNINVDEYGNELVEKWSARLDDGRRWARRLALSKPLVALQGEHIVGFAELSDDGRINAFYSHHLRQRLGIGSALLHAIEARARSNGIDNIRVESSQNASRFFIARRFRQQEKIQRFTDGIASTSVILTRAVDVGTV